jgi:hypothetical protein
MLTVSQILNKREPPGRSDVYTAREWEALHRFAQYAINFLAKPDPNLGRTGSVCPFVPDSFAEGLFRLTSTLATEAAQVEAGMEMMKNVFLEMEPVTDGILKAIVVVFPDVSSEIAGGVIGDLQKRLKTAFVRAGLMIGEFYPGCPEPGLHNKDFRPLHAPVSALAIRHMTKADAPFMLGNPAYLTAYLKYFGEEGSRQIQSLIGNSGEGACPFHSGV